MRLNEPERADRLASVMIVRGHIQNPPSPRTLKERRLNERSRQYV